MWLSGLRSGLWTKGSLVRFPVRAHAWVVGQVLSRGCTRSNHTLMFLSLSFSLPSPLIKKRKKKKEPLVLEEYLMYLKSLLVTGNMSMEKGFTVTSRTGPSPSLPSCAFVPIWNLPPGSWTMLVTWPSPGEGKKEPIVMHEYIKTNGNIYSGSYVILIKTSIHQQKMEA